MLKKDFNESPLNWVGAKRHKIFLQMLPFFDVTKKTLVEPFVGGGNIFMNLGYETNIVNDINPKLIGLYEHWLKTPFKEIEQKIDSIVEKYGLTKTNRDGYLELREEYNKNHDINFLYPLVCYSFNNIFRFNSKGGYNAPFGLDRSSFNDSMRSKLSIFCENIKKKNLVLENTGFDVFIDKVLENNDHKDLFFYLDPPYYNSIATYNSGWGEKEELGLYEILKKLQNLGIPFLLSNSLKNNGVVNPILEGILDKFEVVYPNMDYSNCSYNKKNRDEKNVEILLMNKKI